MHDRFVFLLVGGVSDVSVVRDALERVLAATAERSPGVLLVELTAENDEGLAGLRSLRSTDDADELVRSARRLAELCQGVRAAEPTERPLPLGRHDATKARYRVLVVDDDAALGRAIKRTLSEHDVDVDVTVDPREALERFVTGVRYDAIVCDMLMPDLTGIQLHAELVRIAPEQAPRMLFLTGSRDAPAILAFEAESGCVVLEKPFEADELRAGVRAILSRARAGG